MQGTDFSVVAFEGTFAVADLTLVSWIHVTACAGKRVGSSDCDHWWSRQLVPNAAGWEDDRKVYRHWLLRRRHSLWQVLGSCKEDQKGEPTYDATVIKMLFLDMFLSLLRSTSWASCISCLHAKHTWCEWSYGCECWAWCSTCQFQGDIILSETPLCTSLSICMICLLLCLDLDGVHRLLFMLLLHLLTNFNCVLSFCSTVCLFWPDCA